MSSKELSYQDILDRINQNLQSAKSQKGNQEIEEEYSFLLLKLNNELEQVNRKWDVNSEFNITSHRKKIGKFIVQGKKIVRKFLRWYINPLFSKQKEFNASVTRALNIMEERMNYHYKENKKAESIQNTLNVLQENISSLTQEQNSLKDSVKILDLRLGEVVKSQALLTYENTGFQDTIKRLSELNEHKISEISVKLNDLEVIVHDFNSLRDQYNIIHNGIDSNQKYAKILEDRINTIEDIVQYIRRIVNKNMNKKIITELDHKNDLHKETGDNNNKEFEFDYLFFENKFRGSRNVIKERQKMYLDYIGPNDKVLDIGCGRGELIELLTEKGIESEGIDINEEMIDYCLERGFDVKHADAIKYLSSIAPRSYDCIVMCQVIEHLTFQQYTQLISSMHNALKPGGRIIIETINVQSVYAMSNWFYIDPTHTKPVHPETLDFVIKEIGFVRTERKFLSPVDHINIPSIEKEEFTSFNESIANLYGTIYGNQDYAIIAWR